MNNSKKEKQADICPYQDLFIYYIQGRVKSLNLIDTGAFLGNWEEDDFSFLFFSEQSDKTIDRILKNEPELALLDQYQMTYDQWQGGRLEPLKVGRFIIVPPWKSSEISKEVSEDTISILLDPGVVFGTGTHPTTCDCMDLILQVCTRNNIKTAIDMGTGTGVLAIGAAMLGCSNIFAVDFNLLAVKTAKRNILLNDLDTQILAFQGKAEEFIDIAGDLLIANIHYDVMKKLICSKGFLSKKWFILSGLLRSQAREVACQLAKIPVEIIETREREGIWHTFLGRVC